MRWLARGISLQTRHRADGFDEFIAEQLPDFAASGLRSASLIRLGFTGTLAESDIGGTWDASLWTGCNACAEIWRTIC